MNMEGKQLIISRLLAVLTNSIIYLKVSNEEKKGKKGKENNLRLINDEDNLLV